VKRLILGVGALVVLAALLVGAPLALAAWWGNPWPAGGWAEVQLLTNDAIVGALVAVGWLAWAQMSVCVLIEIAAAIRGRTAGRLRFVAAGQQEFARFLVASVATLGLGASTAAAGGATAYSTATAAPAHAATTVTVAAPPASDTTEDDVTVGSRVTTGTNTTAWKLAETHLGDGSRWKDVLDLNRGTSLADGTTFAHGTQTIPAGTTLLLPADATAIPETGPAGQRDQAGKNKAKGEPEQVDGTHIVEPGDTLWDISADELGDPFRYIELYEASQDTQQPHGEHLTDPDLIKPGWTITVPGTGPGTSTADEEEQARQKPATPQKEKPPTETASPDTPAEPDTPPREQVAPRTETTPAAPAQTSPTPADATGQVGVDDADDDLDADAEDDSVLDTPWVLSGLTGGGVLLAGALYLGLRQRRRAQFRARRPGRAIAPPGPELAPAEMTITAAGNLGEDSLAYIDAALRRLAGTTYANRGVMPAVAAVEIDTGEGGELILHLSEPGDLPQPWRPTPDRLHWHVPTSIPVEDLGELSDEADAPYPLLVTIGRADTGELWLLNCEDLGILTLAGDSDRSRDFARHLVAQLAVNPWSHGVTVDCIGIAAEAEPLGDGIRYHATSADAATVTAEILADAVAMVDRATRHHTDVATGRTGQADDDVWPSRLLLLDAATEQPVHLAALLDLVDGQVGRTATSIVLAGERPDTPGARLDFTAEGRVALERAGLELVAVSLTSKETRGVGLVYAQSEVLDDVEIPVNTAAAEGWEAYVDQAGGLRREHTLPRSTPDTELTESTATLLDADDSDYLTQAAVVPEDLEALAPKVPASVRTEIEETDPTLDRDYADWHDENSCRAKLSLLGPVLVRTHGKPLPKSRPYFTELAAYLWLHRNGATREQVVTAFGTAADTVRKRMNVLRDWLGSNPLTGQPYLPHACKSPGAKSGVNVYQLDNSLLVDWDLFKRLRGRGEARGGAEGRADLVKALELVTGRPCDHRREGGWEWLAEEERHDHYMQVAIADVALTLTTHFLRDGDVGRARAATEIAMLASPDEELTRLCLAHIANAEGNRAEAERILREDVCNRSDDGEAPPELNDRTKAIIRNHDEWMAS
jgi:nucleoid-associated protein YgaU